MENNKPPKASTTVFLIFSTMLLSFALFGCGIYSLYISIGFRFLNRSAIAGLNTASLYTYPNSAFGTGGGTMVGLILVSIVMVALGIAMVIIFFKQLPLYKQIKFVAKMPNVRYKEYSQQAKKSVIVWSIIAYIITIAFSVFALIVVYRSGVSANYLWILATSYFIVLGLSIASMVLMFVKIAQLSKIRKMLKNNENIIEDNQSGEMDETNMPKVDIQQNRDMQKCQFDDNNSDLSKINLDTYASEKQDLAEKDKKVVVSNGDDEVKSQHLSGGNDEIRISKTEQGAQSIYKEDENLDAVYDSDCPVNDENNRDIEKPSIIVNIPEQNKEQKQSIGERLFTDGIFELGDQLVKLREMHVSGLISNEEYTMLREKWIDAVLSEPLFGKKRTKNRNRAISKSFNDIENIDKISK